MTPRAIIAWVGARPAVAVAVLCVPIAVLAFSGFIVIRQWQQSAVALEARRAEQAADYLVATLTRDMRGAQRSVLVPMDFDQYGFDPPEEVVNYVATAFARYPYPESFFGWRDGDTSAGTAFFHRRERPPTWARPPATDSRFPVTVDDSPTAPTALVERIRRDARQGREFSVFPINLDGVPYQVVARLFYRSPWTRELRGVFGFTVNLPWVRDTYYQQLVADLGRRDDATAGYAFRIFDDQGIELAGPQSPARAGGTSRRFPALFYDPLTVGAVGPGLRTDEWIALVVPTRDAASDAAIEGGNRALLLGGVAIVSVVIGLVVIVQGTRRSAQLVALRADFLSSVTHELRTPIASIRGLADTLRMGRYRDPQTTSEYAGLIVESTKRLNRHVDNLLTLSRLTDVSHFYSRAEVSLEPVVMAALDNFRIELDSASFEVQCNIAQDLPAIEGDAEALLLVCDNLIDNALRHARVGRWLGIQVKREGTDVVVRVADRGEGIPADEIPHVTKKFFRGRRATASGTGLGLAIVARTVKEFGGRLTIESAAGGPTSVSVRFPALPAARERAASVADRTTPTSSSESSPTWLSR